MPDLLWSLDQNVGATGFDSASGNPFQPTLFYRGFAACPCKGWQGGQLSLSGGSFGQREGEFQWGRFGSLSAYPAGTVLHQDGWRDMQASDLQNAYGDLGWRGSGGELHLFRQGVDNGDAPNDTPCTNDDFTGFLCTNSGIGTTLGGVPIADFLNGAQYGELDLQCTTTNAYGVSVQLTHTLDIFGLKNSFIAGVAFDGAHTQFNGASYVGGLTTDTRSYIGPGIVIDQPGRNSPISVGITNST